MATWRSRYAQTVHDMSSAPSRSTAFRHRMSCRAQNAYVRIGSEIEGPVLCLEFYFSNKHASMYGVYTFDQYLYTLNQGHAVA
jgi:hypothetical protein